MCCWHGRRGLACSSEGVILEDSLSFLSFQNWLHRDDPFQKAQYLFIEDGFSLSQSAVQFKFPLPGTWECCLAKNLFLELFEVYPL